MTCAPPLSASERPTELHDKAGPLSALTPSAREPSIGGGMGSKQQTLDPGPLLLQHSPTETLVESITLTVTRQIQIDTSTSLLWKHTKILEVVLFVRSEESVSQAEQP
jgi:hypothetical protein